MTLCDPLPCTSSAHAELLLTGKRFEDQPVCWQNMVNELSSQGLLHLHSTYVLAIRMHLAKFNLSFVDNEYPEVSLIKGTVEDLTAWMLAYS